MKKRDTVLILGVASIILLFTFQVFMVRGIWKQKDELFTLRYTLHSQEAMGFISRRSPTDGFDTVRLLLGKYSAEANKKLLMAKDQKDKDIMKKEIYEYVNSLLNHEQDLSGLLSSYFERRGFDKNFKHSVVINNLEMINKDTVVIYQSQEFASRRLQGRTGRGTPPEISKVKILVNMFRIENDNCRLFFEYYIDFSDKQQQILKETLVWLGLSMFSILVVIIIFMVTYRNLVEEKRLSNLKTDFINNMTHELKTPLSTITVAGKTLEMPQIRSNEQKILETAKMIGKQSVHLNQLINMILEISMWERTQFQLDKKKVDIEELMNDVVDSFKSGGGHGATIIQKYNLKGTQVDIDAVYFTTLINNLLSNAVKYSDKVPVIEVEGLTAEDRISIKITDNGIGIGKTDQKHIFDKFYRASTGNIHKYKGLGLGLYYVRKIAEAHGGDVSVSSRPGKGSSFTVTLPIS
jgi:signal transduction histidine kinase